MQAQSHLQLQTSKGGGIPHTVKSTRQETNSGQKQATQSSRYSGSTVSKPVSASERSHTQLTTPSSDTAKALLWHHKAKGKAASSTGKAQKNWESQAAYWGQMYKQMSGQSPPSSGSHHPPQESSLADIKETMTKQLNEARESHFRSESEEERRHHFGSINSLSKGLATIENMESGEEISGKLEGPNAEHE